MFEVYLVLAVECNMVAAVGSSGVSTGSATKVTSAARTATRRSTRVRKPPTRLLEEM